MPRQCLVVRSELRPAQLGDQRISVLDIIPGANESLLTTLREQQREIQQKLLNAQ